MKPINAFTWNDYESRIDKMWKPVGVHKLAEGDCQSPVTILPGHLAEMLRWRKAGEEEPKEGKPYVVDGLGVCRLYIDDDGDRAWVSHKFGDIYDGFEDDETYRPAIPGIDYVEGEV